MIKVDDNGSSKCNEMVKVAVRCRPLSSGEISKECKSVVNVNPSTHSVEICNYSSDYKNNKGKVFTFDAAYDSSCNQQDLYNNMVRSMVSSALNGFNCTVFAYGQSGTGKTYTMEGCISKGDRGVILMTFDQIFYHISKSCNIQYLVRMSYLEIYQDEIKDLLNINSKMNYELRENKDMGVYVTNLKSFICKNVKQMEKILAAGRQNRAIGMTNINEKSSRSHAIVVITVEMDFNSATESRITVGKLNLVDLAGSERQRKTNCKGTRLREASRINLSLSALGNVISALANDKDQFVPYRDSKLTRLLKDSLGGNSKTLMIATISPACLSYDETLNTLRYASRTRNIKNKPLVNDEPIDTLLEKYQDEIKRLKAKLAEKIALQRDRMMKKSNNNESENEGHQLRRKSKIKTEENDQEKPIIVNCEPEEVEKKYVEELSRRIESMENRLLTGTTTFTEHTNKQQQALEAQQSKIKISTIREREMQVILNIQEQVADGIKGEYTNLQHEVQSKSKDLIAALRELECIQQEIQDVKEDFNTDRRELEMSKHELLKDLKLRLLIMENFIPNEDRRKVYSRLYYDEDRVTWLARVEYETIENIPKMKCVTFVRRPTTLHSPFTVKNTNQIYRNYQRDENRQITFRFKGENLLELKLINSLPTTMVYKAPLLSPVLDSAFKYALQLEKDLDIDASSSKYNTQKLTSSASKVLLNKTNQDKKCKSRNEAAPVYPKARGLVPK